MSVPEGLPEFPGQSQRLVGPGVGSRGGELRWGVGVGSWGGRCVLSRSQFFYYFLR